MSASKFCHLRSPCLFLGCIRFLLATNESQTPFELSGKICILSGDMHPLADSLPSQAFNSSGVECPGTCSWHRKSCPSSFEELTELPVLLRTDRFQRRFLLHIATIDTIAELRFQVGDVPFLVLDHLSNKARDPSSPVSGGSTESNWRLQKKRCLHESQPAESYHRRGPGSPPA